MSARVASCNECGWISDASKVVGGRCPRACATPLEYFQRNATITEQMCDEVETIRAGYINQQVQRKVGARFGDATPEQIGQWAVEAGERWDGYYPALGKLVAS